MTWRAAAAGLAVLLLIGLLVLRGPDRTGQENSGAPPTPPPGARDPGNRGILIEGGGFSGRRFDTEADTLLEGPRSRVDESSFYPLTVPDFWMQEHEVTNEEFRRYDADHEFPVGRERYPVARITWEEAMGYAVSLGGLLPTEAQWQFAAEGPEGRKYPWGDSEPTCENTQFRGCDPRGPIEVMSRPDGATPEGIHDLAGNVSEWVRPNWFEPGKTPVNDASRRLRGGSFHDEPFFLRARNRNNDFFEGFVYDGAGFRVVWSVEDG